MPDKNTCQMIAGDAFCFLRSLQPSSIDLIVSSPPYFMGKAYDTSLSLNDFVEIHNKLLPELVRVLKAGGSICWQVGSHVNKGALTPLDALIYYAFSKTDEIKLRNRIIWTFGHGEHARKRLSGRHESIMWYTKGDRYYFDLDSIRVPQKYPGKRHYKGPKKGQWSGNPAGKNPSDVWDIPNVKANHIEKTAHPCQFPVGLVQRLVKALSPASGLIMDPFMGSGSSAIGALCEGRNFVGCDLNSDYVDIASKRVDEFQRGVMKFRSIDTAIHVPSGNEMVAKKPPHFGIQNAHG